MGVPGQGGALIYDTTAWTDDQYNQLDMATFANVKDVDPNAESICYQTGGQDGLISFYTKDGEGTLISTEGGAKPDNKDHTTLLVALPYTTNIPRNGLGASEVFQRAYFELETTVHFGKLGENDYTWTKFLETSNGFDEPDPGFSLEKWAIDRSSGDGSESLSNRGKDRLGYLSGVRHQQYAFYWQYAALRIAGKRRRLRLYR